MNPIIIEKVIELTDEEKNIIDFFNSYNFPLFYQKTTSERYWQYSHTFLVRNTLGNEQLEGIVNSNNYKLAYELFKSICDSNGLIFKKIYRAALNSTGYHSDLHGDIHNDLLENTKHNVFLFYLNNFDYGYTFLFDDNDRIIHTIKPQKNKVVVFDGKYKHAQGFCSPGQRRLILVFNYE